MAKGFDSLTLRQMCACATEWLGGGLQIRFMQVRLLSRTPIANESSVVNMQQYTKKFLTKSVD